MNVVSGGISHHDNLNSTVHFLKVSSLIFRRFHLDLRFGRFFCFLLFEIFNRLSHI
jgi:hypothetical protein